VLPHASVALHVLVTTLLKPVAQSAGLSVLPINDTVGVPQASVAVADPGSGTVALQSSTCRNVCEYRSCII
jgi:hypothetical protein